jgi:uncharacterized membrane protein YdbT with pleckstrin-like domain
MDNLQNQQAVNNQQPQKPKEQILMSFSTSRRSNLFMYLLSLILFGAAYYVYTQVSISFGNEITVLLILFGVLNVIFQEVRRLDGSYYITPHRAVEISGIFRKKRSAIRLIHIESVNAHQSVFNRVLGIGDIEIKTTRETIGFRKISNPGKVQNLIRSELNKSASQR